MPNYLPDWSLINFFQPKQFHVGVDMEKLHSLPCLHVFNIIHAGTWRAHAKFWPFWSKYLAMMLRHHKWVWSHTCTSNISQIILIPNICGFMGLTP